MELKDLASKIDDLASALVEDRVVTTNLLRDLMGAIGKLTQAITHNFELLKVQDGGATDNHRRESNAVVIFGTAAIIFGLMTPMYILVRGVSNELQTVTVLMRADDERERIDAEADAELRGEVKAHSELIKFISLNMQRDNDREERDISRMATLTEKVRALERGKLNDYLSLP